MTKTVLITGCSSGIGKTTAKLFAAKGWNLVATMRNPAADTDLASLKNVLVTRLDVQDRASIEAAIKAGISRFGRIDALVNNAGFGLFGVFETISREKIQEQFAVNVFGVMDVTRALLPHFRANQSGVILNISSGAGFFGLPLISLYAASKFALEGFSEALSYELASQNIAVKVIEPGGVLSTNFSQRSGQEFGQIKAISDYDAFLANANALFTNLRGSRAGTEEHVAQVIYDAATDGTDRLRYVATDDIKPLAKMRRESSEEQYMDFMRARFREASEGLAKSA
jgi:NAD(P)-dependent dehydrogenase (short-subunit alcohol dehydrogenase family)